MTPQYIEIDSTCNKKYYKDKEMTIFHREGGPAIEYNDGLRYWFIDGKYHRVGGPAIEHNGGLQIWCIDGKRHRENGPAIIRVNGSKLWYIHGKHMTEKEFDDRNNSCEGKVVEVDGKKYKLVSI